MSAAGGPPARPAGVPRATWLAAGSAAAAAAAAAGLPPVTALVAGLAVLAIGLGLRSSLTRPRAAIVCIAAATGATLLATRLLVGPGAQAPPPLPTGTGPWTATVDSVGSPRDGSQTTRLSLLVESGPVQVAATLPAYPVVRSG